MERIESLQTLTTKRLLEQIYVNDYTKESLDDFVLQYLLNRPQIVNKIINAIGLYHVFYRLEDPRDNPNLVTNDIYLIKSFITFNEAEQWILENGKLIVYEQEENYNRPVVLTIIYFDNQGNYATSEDPSYIYNIAAKKYPTYAFSQEGYKMLIKEHEKAISYNDVDVQDYVPYWIKYIKDDGSIMIGITMNDLLKIHNHIKFYDNDFEIKKQHIQDLLDLQNNPVKYIKKRNK